METQGRARRFKPFIKSNSGRQPRTRAPSSKFPALSENHGSTEHEFAEMRKKRVKITHSEYSRPPISDAPKTSEYAFFKKFKEGMGSSCHPLHKDRSQMNPVNVDDPHSESSNLSNVFKFTERSIRSPVQAQQERPTYQFSFPARPICNESHHAGGSKSKDDCRKFESRHPLPCADVTPVGKNLVLSPFPSLPKSSGVEHVGRGIFEARRHKLRQLIANSNPGVGEGCSNGFDSVSALLNRLLPGSYENECHQYTRSEGKMTATSKLAAPWESYSEEKTSASFLQGRQYTRSEERVMDTTYQLALPWESYGEEKTRTSFSQGHHHMSSEERVMDTPYQSAAPWESYNEENFITSFLQGQHHARSEEMVVDTTYHLAAPRESYSEGEISILRNPRSMKFGSCSHDGFPEYWFGRPRNRVFSKWDITKSTIQLAEHDAATGFQIEDMNSFCSLDGEATKKNSVATDSIRYLCLDDYQSTYSGHSKQLDWFHDLNEIPTREPPSLLLSWNTTTREELHSGCELASSSNAAYELKLDDCLNAPTVHTAALDSNYSSDLRLLTYYPSAQGQAPELGIDNVDTYTDLEAYRFLPSTPRCLTMAENCENSDDENSVFLHCQDDPCCIDTYSARQCHNEALPGGFADDIGWKLLPSSEFSSDGYPSSQIFQLPFNSEYVNSLALVQEEEISFQYTRNRESTDIFDIPSRFTSNFNLSIDKLLGQPLLLDYSGRIRSED